MVGGTKTAATPEVLKKEISSFPNTKTAVITLPACGYHHTTENEYH